MLASTLPTGNVYGVETLAERLAFAIDYRKISQNGLDSVAKLPRGYTSRIKNSHRTRVNPELLKRIADALTVNFEWLAVGKGPMLPDGHTPEAAERKVVEPVIEMREVVRDREIEDPYPNRVIVRSKMRGYYDDLSPRAKAIFDGRFNGGDMSEEQWQERLLTLAKAEKLGLMPIDHSESEEYVPMKLK